MAKYQTLSLRQKPELRIEFLVIMDLWKFLGQIERSLRLLEEEESGKLFKSEKYFWQWFYGSL